MVNSQLIELVRQFTQAEMKEFTLFVRSPYFNRGVFQEETILLWEFIQEAAPDFNAESLDKKSAYLKLFSDKYIIEGKIDKVMSELHLMVKDFIGFEVAKRNGGEFQMMLHQVIYFRERRMDNRYQNTVRKLQILLEEHKKLDQTFFEEKFRLDYELQVLENRNNTKKDDAHLLDAVNSLDLHYLGYKIEMLSRYFLQQKVTRLPVSEEIEHAVDLINLSESSAAQYPILLIGYKILCLIRAEEPSVEAFEELEMLLRQHQSGISEARLKIYYTYLRNFCTLLYNSGKTNFLPVVHRLQKEHYNRGYLFFEEGKILVNAFINVVNIALRVNDLEWSELFIEENSNRIFEDDPEQNYYRLGKALYLLRTNRFEEALEILPQHFQELDLLLMLKRTELKLYYELNSDLLPYKIDAFKVYISRSSKKIINDATKERHNNFVNLLSLMSQMIPGDKKRAEKLQERLQEKALLAEREWLLEKTAEMLR